jgi:2'-5' RNA ligase
MITTTNRLFFAIDLPDLIRQSITDLMTQLKQETWAKYIRWTLPENLHITLRFLGACSAEQIEAVVKTTKNAIKTLKPFPIYLNKINLFPSKTNPHVLAIIINPASALFQLAQNIEQTVVAHGFTPEERAYLPHLTLGRLTRSKPIYFQNTFPLFEIHFVVDKFVLLNSEVIANKRHYKAIETFAL